MNKPLTPHQVLDLAMRCLAESSLSEAGLQRKLRQQLANQRDADTLIKKTVARLNELGMLNDHDAAALIARRHAHKGDRFIRQKLNHAGIDEITIAKTLAELGDEYTRAKEVALKKWATYTDSRVSPQQHQNKLFRFLSSRGFSSDTCVQIVNDISTEITHN